MKIRPLQDRVIVKRVAEQEKSKGGIIIPDTAKEKPLEGVESGKVRRPDVRAGDRVLFVKYAGNEVMFDGVEHLMLRADDLLCVIEEGTVNV